MKEHMKNTAFYKVLNTVLRERLPEIKNEVEPVLQKTRKDNKFDYPLTYIFDFERISHDIQWRLEVDFNDYEWSYKTVKPHFLGVFFSLEKGKDVTRFYYNIYNSFNEDLENNKTEEIEDTLLGNDVFIEGKQKELNQFLDELTIRLIEEMKFLDFEQLEFLEDDE